MSNVIKASFTLEDVGFWISPTGESVDVYHPMSTHEQIAKNILGDQDEERPIKKLLLQGWVRVSMGTLFNAKHFRHEQKELVKEFIRKNLYLYKDATIELQSFKQTILVPAQEFLAS